MKKKGENRLRTPFNCLSPTFFARILGLGRIEVDQPGICLHFHSEFMHSVHLVHREIFIDTLK